MVKHPEKIPMLETSPPRPFGAIGEAPISITTRAEGIGNPDSGACWLKHRGKVLGVGGVLGTFCVIYVIIFAATNRKTSSDPNPICTKWMPPPQGEVSCTTESNQTYMKCNFSCASGYELVGVNSIECDTGKWNEMPPKCEPACPKLPGIEHGDIMCTNREIVNSSCTFACRDDRQIQGKTVLSCQSNKEWSNSEPSCVCPPCSIGDKCQFSTNWQHVVDALAALIPYKAITIDYGGKFFTCHTNPHMHSLAITWSGKCIDRGTTTWRTCTNYKSSKGAAEHAAAQLIRKMVNQSIYPVPCDPDDMVTGC